MNQKRNEKRNPQNSMDEMDSKGQQFAAKTVDPLAYNEDIKDPDAEGLDPNSEDYKFILWDRKFARIIKDPKNDVLSYYIEESLLPKFQALKAEYYSATSPSEKVDIDKKLDKFCDFAVTFVNNNFYQRIWDPITRKYHNLSQFELQKMLNAAVDRLNLEDLSERIIRQEFHELPRRLRLLVDKHPDFVKAAIQSLIKTKLIYNTKDELDAPLAAAEGATQRITIDPVTGLEIEERRQGRGGLGRGPLDETKFLFHLLTKNIRLMSIDNEQKENFLKEALALLEGTYSTPTAENPVSKPIVQGGRERGPTLRKGLYQHTTPLTYAGLLDRYKEQAGETFGNLTNEQKQQIIDQFYQDVHNRESAHLPHSAKMGKYTFSSRGPSELGENFEQIIKGNLVNRLMAAQKIHKKEQEPHTFMDDADSAPENAVDSTASVLKH